jgi:hypothetical protein
VAGAAEAVSSGAAAAAGRAEKPLLPYYYVLWSLTGLGRTVRAALIPRE